MLSEGAVTSRQCGVYLRSTPSATPFNKFNVVVSKDADGLKPLRKSF